MSAHTDRPISVRAERVFRWWDYPLFATLTVINLIAAGAFFMYWVSLRDWQVEPIAFAILLAIAALIWLNHLLRWFLLPLMRKPRFIPARPGYRVGVATTFVPGAEPLDMLERTVRALCALDYPHDTWVLDEGDDERVHDLCRRLGARHFSRKGLPNYQTPEGPFKSRTKYGNYNAWFHAVAFDCYDIITTFDPDHVPDENFLSQVLGYFEDPRIAYVQVAQAYRNQGESLVARGAAEETYAYQSSVQMAGYAFGYPIVVGCHNTHRVTALREVGGFPRHDADDLLITLRYRGAAWEGVYVPQVLARGLAPVDWYSYLHQQRRWARSVLDIKFRMQPKILASLPARTRIAGLLHGFNYLHRSFAIFGALGLIASLLVSGESLRLFSTAAVPRVGGWFAACLICELYRQRFYLQPGQEWGFHWRTGVLQLAKWPYMLFALLDVLSRRVVPYTITPKERTATKILDLFWPHLLAALLLGAAWALGTWNGSDAPVALQLTPLFVALATLAAARCGPRQTTGKHKSLVRTPVTLGWDTGGQDRKAP